MEAHTNNLFKEDKREFEKFVKNLTEQRRWQPKYVKCAIAAKKASRNQRGEVFNCFVLSRPTVEKEDPRDEFIQFLKLLQENLKTFKEDTRFELAVYDESKTHWTAFDFLIKKDGSVNVLCIDAANDSSADESFKKIVEYFPGCNAKLLEADPNPLNRKKLRLIQSDDETCALMTLEHIFRLSARDEFLSFPNMPGNKISPADLVKQAPELYRVTQSLLTLSSFLQDDQLKSAMSQPVSKKGLNIFQYIEPHTDIGKNSLGENVKQNKTIEYKMTNLKKIILKFIESLTVEELNRITDPKFKDWKEFLTDESKRKSYMYQEIATQPLKSSIQNIMNKLIQDEESHMPSKKKFFQQHERGNKSKRYSELKQLQKYINNKEFVSEDDLKGLVKITMKFKKLDDVKDAFTNLASTHFSLTQSMHKRR